MTQANDVLAVSPELLAKPITRAPRAPARVVGVILAATVAAVWFINLFMLGVMGPKHAEIYTDLGLALPLATEWVLDLARYFDLASYPFAFLLLFAIPLTIGVGLVFAARADSAQIRMASIVTSIILLVLAAFAFLVVPMILAIPLEDLSQQLNAAP
jgi:type II secretory pathway component PulF